VQASSSAVSAAKKFTPLFSRVLVQKYRPTKTTVNGLHLPESAQLRQNIGIVLAVGDKVEAVKVNDHVFLSEFAGTEVKIDGEELHLYRDEDLLGIVKQ
jgi:chaperonin GroES